MATATAPVPGQASTSCRAMTAREAQSSREIKGILEGSGEDDMGVGLLESLSGR